MYDHFPRNFLWNTLFVSCNPLEIKPEEIAETLRSIEVYSFKSTEEEKADLYWNWAKAWILMGLNSFEVSDLIQGLTKFRYAAELGCNSSYFWLDKAIAYMVYGMYLGEPGYLEKALALLRTVLIKHSDNTKAWVAYAMVCKRRYALTHLYQHFEEADTAFREAILSAPTHADLWLEWGEMYLHLGWLTHDVKAIETAMDKLTSSKLQETDPLRVSANLGRSLLYLGLHTDNLSWLHEGKARILAALETSPKHGELLSAAGYAELGLGIYFLDKKFYSEAVTYFVRGIEADATRVENWHGLFQTYLNWGILEADPILIRKGVHAIARICQLRPYSSLYLNEWGEAILQSKQIEENPKAQQALVEEAILKFKQALILYHDPDILYNYGCACDQLGDLSGNEKDYEQAIEALSLVYEKEPQDPSVRYHLALSLSHLGELTSNVDCLYHSIELFEPLSETDQEDATLFREFGYTLLNLSELVYDPFYPSKGEQLRVKAEQRLLNAVKLGSKEANYHLACLYSLSSLVKASIYFLKRAEEMNALPPDEDLKQDEWLANVRETEFFKEFMMR